MTAFPRLARIRQQVPYAPIADIAQAVHDEFTRIELGARLKPGARIAVGAGSRGIASYAEVVGAVVNELKRLGASPFVFPAMGSHGGATAEGQAGILAEWGITPETMGCPVVSDMDVVHVGTTETGIPVYCDANAFHSDGIIVVNRVKVHTDFHGPTESGLRKMLAIGLGKRLGAEPIHKRGAPGLRNEIPLVAAMQIERAPILCGVGIVEDGAHNVSYIEAIPAQQIPELEPLLLKRSYSLLARLPVDACDLLIVDYMGKDISGAGMDNNVLGRMYIDGEPEPESPRIEVVAVRRLTPASHGNATGIGFADLVTQQLIDEMDEEVTQVNMRTSGFMRRAVIPPILPNDRALIARGLEIIAERKPNVVPTVMRIRDTLSLEEIAVSESLLPELLERPGIELLSPPQEMMFNEQDELL
jgi:hypothetical protein